MSLQVNKGSLCCHGVIWGHLMKSVSWKYQQRPIRKLFFLYKYLCYNLIKKLASHFVSVCISLVFGLLWCKCHALSGNISTDKESKMFMQNQDINAKIINRMGIIVTVPSTCCNTPFSYRNSRHLGGSFSHPCLSMQSLWPTSAGAGPSTCCSSASLHTSRRCLALRLAR